MEFLKSLEKYGWKKSERVDWIKVGGLVIIIVIVSSWLAGKQRQVFLQAGSSPTPENIEMVIKKAAQEGDYELAQKLYEARKVLGAKENEDGLEEVVYPEKKLREMLRGEKKNLEKSPYLKTALINVARIYTSLGQEQKAQEYWEMVEWVDPSD